MKVTLISHTPDPQRLIETCARISYESKNDPFDQKVNSEFIKKLIKNGHESPLEHASATFLIEDVSRACSHQLVRHRLASFTQRSDRYTGFSTQDAKHAPAMTMPVAFHNIDKDLDQLRNDTKDDPSLFRKFRNAFDSCIRAYEGMLEAGVPKEDARFILPQGMSTSLYMTANFREWRHFLELRLDRHAQWEIRSVADKVLFLLITIASDCFFDFGNGAKQRETVCSSNINSKLIKAERPVEAVQQLPQVANETTQNMGAATDECSRQG